MNYFVKLIQGFCSGLPRSRATLQHMCIVCDICNICVIAGGVRIFDEVMQRKYMEDA